jgi:DNA invertase Pin-like site-specific DNA recombinase
MTDEELTRAVCNPPRPELARPDDAPPPPAYGYVRVSTLDQARSGCGIEAQADTIRRWCQAHRLDLKAFYMDQAESSGTRLWRRPQGDLMDRRLRKGDHVVFAKLDRGFRDTVEMLQTVEAWIKKGIVVHFCDLGIDTTSPAWVLLATVQSAFARAERDRIRERTAEALMALRRQGRQWTRRAPVGYRWAPDPQRRRTKRGDLAKVVVPDQAQWEQMWLIADLVDEGYTYHDIWRKLLRERVRRATDGKEWDISSIRLAHKRCLQYEAYLAQQKEQAQ